MRGSWEPQFLTSQSEVWVTTWDLLLTSEVYVGSSLGLNPWPVGSDALQADAIRTELNNGTHLAGGVLRVSEVNMAVVTVKEVNGSLVFTRICNSLFYWRFLSLIPLALFHLCFFCCFFTSIGGECHFQFRWCVIIFHLHLCFGEIVWCFIWQMLHKRNCMTWLDKEQHLFFWKQLLRWKKIT